MFDVGFRLGREIGRVEGLAFEGIGRSMGWTLGAAFEFRRSWFDSYVDYERKLLEGLREVQWRRSSERAQMLHSGERLRIARGEAEHASLEARELPWSQRWWMLARRPWEAAVEMQESELAGRRQSVEYGRVLERRIEAELYKVRQAVDAELADGRGQACTVDALRWAPNRPRSVREYGTIEEFLHEDPRRSLGRWDLVDAGGMDLGYHWRLEDPVRRWDTTRWRVSWLDDSTHEVYAIEIVEHPEPEGPKRGRVWLLGVIDDKQAVLGAVSELERHAQRERNSLVVVARAVSATANRRREATAVAS